MRFALLVVSMLVGCGAPPEEVGGRDAGTSITCSPSASLKDEVMNGRTIGTGSGSVTCSSATQLQVETCLQWEEGGAFTDVKCVSSSQTGVTTLSVDSATGCIGTHRFRAKVVGNGKEALSAEQSVTCM
ncbi:MAG: hypothetical protein ACO1OB_13975 [Archangium sp.]